MEKSNEELIEELQYEVNQLEDKVERLQNTLYDIMGVLRQRGIW